MKKHKTSDIIKDMLLEMIINSAITFEQDSMDFYCNAVEKAHEPESRNLLVMLMREEENHIEKLRSISRRGFDEVIQSVDTREIQLLDGEYVEKQRKISADATVSEILKLAMERETASYQFYSLLAGRTKIEPVKNLFAFLAKQESDHRKYIETEYNRLNKK